MALFNKPEVKVEVDLDEINAACDRLEQAAANLLAVTLASERSIAKAHKTVQALNEASSRAAAARGTRG